VRATSLVTRRANVAAKLWATRVELASDWAMGFEAESESTP